MSTPQDSSRPPGCDDQAFLTNGRDGLHASTRAPLLDNETLSEGERHLVPGPHEGLSYDFQEGHAMFSPASTPRHSNITFDDKFYLNLLQEVTRYPEDYYHLPECAQDYDVVTVPIGEMSAYPATSYETLGGPIFLGYGVTSPSVHKHGSTIPHSAHRNEDAAPHDFLSAGQANRLPMASDSSSVASIRVAPASLNRKRFSCRVCDVSFVQMQGLNRHNRDKHQPRNICPHCGVFEWSIARNYLFTKHLKRDHPGIAL